MAEQSRLPKDMMGGGSYMPPVTPGQKPPVKKPDRTQYPPEELDYRPNWAIRSAEAVTATVLPGVKNTFYNPFGFPGDWEKDRLHNGVKVWSDAQQKLVSAYEYLRETEPVERDVIGRMAEDAAEVAHKAAKKKIKALDPESMAKSKAREVFIEAPLALVPKAGPALKGIAKTMLGMDVETMGDATITGANRRRREEVRNEYDQLAVHFKRQEVQAAVAGRPYEPNFLMGIEHVRRVTDGMQDFTRRPYDEAYKIDRYAMDESEFGESYRSLPRTTTQKAADESYKTKKTQTSMGKAAVNWQNRRTPIA